MTAAYSVRDTPEPAAIHSRDAAARGGAVLFAGGGTGGHIFPGLAVVDRLREAGAAGVEPHFLVSSRPLDSDIMHKQGLGFTPLPARPLSARPWGWPAFLRGWLASVDAVKHVIRERQAVAVVAMGGFVAAPAVIAARRAGVPVGLVNLDAVPGRANRVLARFAAEVFSAYPVPEFGRAREIGVPLRRSAIGPADKAEARAALGLDPTRETLFVTAGSQGAQSVNRLMVELCNHAQPRKALATWQVFHLAGGRAGDVEDLRRAYAKAGLAARVEGFCDTMGLAWSAATIAVSRAGANAVAEAWANAVPTIFLPYPYHKDQHQRLNAESLRKSGAALVYTDHVDPIRNTRELNGPLTALMANAPRRKQMTAWLREKLPPDGAEVIAEWVRGLGG